MAQQKREEQPKVGDIMVKVNVDTDEAVRALKALQRHARETTQVLREVESAQDSPFGNAKFPPDLLATYSTKELAEELSRREGVVEYRVDAHGGYAKLSIDNHTEGNTEFIEGPARIVVDRD